MAGRGSRRKISPLLNAEGGLAEGAKRTTSGSTWGSDNEDKLYETKSNVERNPEYDTPSSSRARRGGKRAAKSQQDQQDESEEMPSPVTPPPPKLLKRPPPKSVSKAPSTSAPRKMLLSNSVSPGGLLWPSKLDSVLAMGAPSSSLSRDESMESPSVLHLAGKRGYREPEPPRDEQPKSKRELGQGETLRRTTSVMELSNLRGRESPKTSHEPEVDDWQDSEEEEEVEFPTTSRGPESTEELFKNFAMAQRLFFANLVTTLDEFGSILQAQKTMNARIRAQQNSHSEKIAKLRRLLVRGGEVKIVGVDDDSDN